MNQDLYRPPTVEAISAAAAERATTARIVLTLAAFAAAIAWVWSAYASFTQPLSVSIKFSPQAVEHARTVGAALLLGFFALHVFVGARLLRGQPGSTLLVWLLGIGCSLKVLGLVVALHKSVPIEISSWIRLGLIAVALAATLQYRRALAR